MVDGVNRVGKDGRYTLPTELAEKYRGEYFAAYETDDGEIKLKQIEDEP